MSVLPPEPKFDWQKFFMFAMPYGLFMAIINPHWGFIPIMISAFFFGLIVTIMTRPSDTPHEIQDEQFDGALPEALVIAHSGTKRILTSSLCYMGMILFGSMALLSAFIDLIDPVGAEQFNKTLHLSFFSFFVFIFYTINRGLGNYAVIYEDKIKLFQNKLIWGHREHLASFKELDEIKVTFWGSVQVKVLNRVESFSFGAILGLDLSYYHEMNIDENLIHNPNYRASYQITHFLRKKVKEAKENTTQTQTQTEDKLAA